MFLTIVFSYGLISELKSTEIQRTLEIDIRSALAHSDHIPLPTDKGFQKISEAFVKNQERKQGPLEKIQTISSQTNRIYFFTSKYYSQIQVGDIRTSNEISLTTVDRNFRLVSIGVITMKNNNPARYRFFSTDPANSHDVDLNESPVKYEPHELSSTPSIDPILLELGGTNLVKVAVIDSGVRVNTPQINSSIDFLQGDLLKNFRKYEQQKIHERLSKILRAIRNHSDSSQSGLKRRAEALKHYLKIIEESPPLDLHSGRDFADHDENPNDVATRYLPEETPAVIFSHGTSVAHLVAFGNPLIKIIPVRIIRGGMDSYATVEYAALRGARIINISSNRKNLDSGLLDAIEDHPEILFVNCAGNEGRNIKQHPNYPAAHPFPNLLVVANAVGTGLNPRSNFSDEFVHLAELGTYIPAVDVNEKISLHTGTSFSAPKISHLAAEILTIHPDLKPTEIIDIIRESIDQTAPSDLVGKVKWPGFVNRERALRLAASKFATVKMQP